MSQKTDLKAVEAALARAAQRGVAGSRDARSGQFVTQKPTASQQPKAPRK